MQCQMVGCHNQAKVWNTYDDVPGYAYCQPCAERLPKQAKDPEKLKFFSLDGDTEILLTKLNASTEDERIFGKDAWVYCNQHLKPHQTGWCTVSVRDKVGLGVNDPKEAYAKCQKFGLELVKHN